LHMLKRKLPALTTSLALRAYTHSLRVSQESSYHIPCDTKYCCYCRVIKKRCLVRLGGYRSISEEKDQVEKLGVIMRLQSLRMWEAEQLGHCLLLF
jgi:hypothetical protein